MSIREILAPIFSSPKPEAEKRPVGPGGKDQVEFFRHSGLVEALEERAAVLEFDAGLSGAESASLAWRDVCCRSCKNRSTPGLAFPGYCAARSDLPPAYGAGHPLHQLPTDFGSTCTRWAPHD